MAEQELMDCFMLDLIRTKDLLTEQLQYIGHEIFKRGLLINKFDRYQIV